MLKKSLRFLALATEWLSSTLSKQLSLKKSTFLVLASATLALTSCSRQGKQTHSVFGQIHKHTIRLHIALPKNTHVFDNLVPTVYEAFTQRYQQLGYILTDKQEAQYTLITVIKNLDTIQKFVSPDVLLAHVIMRLELECTLLDDNDKKIGHKVFTHSSSLSRPKNPILNTDFEHYEYKKLIARIVPKIEHHFRPILLQAVDKDNES
ncbi:MAG: hypothetical protein H6679_01565 [Epsilonproteobacteria bacterium]|nr:hypothetical protein [Campylobacterota bacterium]